MKKKLKNQKNGCNLQEKKNIYKNEFNKKVIFHIMNQSIHHFLNVHYQLRQFNQRQPIFSYQVNNHLHYLIIIKNNVKNNQHQQIIEYIQSKVIIYFFNTIEKIIQETKHNNQIHV